MTDGLHRSSHRHGAPNGALPTPARSNAPSSRVSLALGVGGNVLITLSGISPASSVFILGGAALAAYGTGVFWGFAIAGVISLLIAFCYAELASRHPVAGGDYSLVSRTLGPAAGVAIFFVGLVTLPLIVAVFALGVADYLGVAIGGLDPVGTAVVVTVLATVTACLNIRTNAWVTGAFLFIEMAALALLTVLGLIHVERPLTALLDPQAIDASTSGTGPARHRRPACIAVTQGIFSYNGYGGAVYFAEETKNATPHHRPGRALERVITILAEIIPLAAILLGTNSPARVCSAPTSRSRRSSTSAPATPSPSSCSSRSRWPSSTPSSPSPCSPAGCSSPPPATTRCPARSSRPLTRVLRARRCRGSPPSSWACSPCSPASSRSTCCSTPPDRPLAFSYGFIALAAIVMRRKPPDAARTGCRCGRCRRSSRCVGHRRHLRHAACSTRRSG